MSKLFCTGCRAIGLVPMEHRDAYACEYCAGVIDRVSYYQHPLWLIMSPDELAKIKAHTRGAVSLADADGGELSIAEEK